MAQIASAVDTDFTPAVGDFSVEVTAAGGARLLVKGAAGATFVPLVDLLNERRIVANPVAGAVYRFATISGTPVVRADQ